MTGALISGGLTLAVLVLPIVIITTSEALRAVPAGSVRPPTASAPRGGRSSAATCCPTRRRASSPGWSSPWRVRSARRRPCSWWGPSAGLLRHGRHGSAEFLGAYTALPVPIFTWTSRPQQAFQDLAAAAIVVMMLVLVLVNGVAIWLRNRYERRW